MDDIVQEVHDIGILLYDLDNPFQQMKTVTVVSGH
jgi:hypothetical protein